MFLILLSDDTDQLLCTIARLTVNTLCCILVVTYPQPANPPHHGSQRHVTGLCFSNFAGIDFNLPAHTGFDFT